jgi:AraC-like DNA-binding protein
MIDDAFATALAAFLPLASAEYLQDIVPAQALTLANSWLHLHSLVASVSFDMVLLDPGADGRINIEAAIDILGASKFAPVVAYVSPSPVNLKAVFELSKNGLAQVHLHPLGNRELEFRRTIENVSDRSLVQELLSRLEPALGRLPFTIVRAIDDLFRRPYRYDTGSDLARQSNVPVKRLYRLCGTTCIGTPKRLVTVAKMLRGYTYLRRWNLSVPCVSQKLGYSSTKLFAANSEAIFGCSPAKLARNCNGLDIVARLRNWLSPPERRPRY